MDLQGTPIGATAQGTKNTSDPEAYKEESAGLVTSDSLAAESARDGGAFNDNRSGDVLGSSSDLVDRDISSATTLAPAPDAAEREAKAAWQDEFKGPGGQKYPEGAGGQGEFPGSHNADGYSGGSTKAKQELASRAEDNQGTEVGGGSGEHGSGDTDKNTSGNTREASSGDTDTNTSGNTQEASSGDTDTNTSGKTQGASSGNPRGNASGTLDEETARETSGENPTSRDESRTSRDPPPSNVAVAPSYVAGATAQSGKPKGKNLTEGGFDDTDDSAANNASFTADIGSENDPGRAAEQGFQRTNAAVAGSGGPRQSEVTGNGQYDVLEGEQSL